MHTILSPDVCWNGFLSRSLHAPFVSFTHSCADKFYGHLISKSLLSGKLLHSLLHFTLSSKIQSKIYVTEKSSIDAKSITWIRFALNLVHYFWGICNSCAANCGHLHQEMFVITGSLSLNLQLKQTVHETTWKKSHFNRCLGSIVNSAKLIIKCMQTLSNV